MFPRPWGGRRLDALFGKPLPDPQTPYGEAWEVSDRPEGSSRVSGGALDGKSLAELITEHPTAFGTEDRFPLLFKLLDCRQTLSVQVHPDDDAGAAEGDLGKEEAWYVIEADDEASLYLGFDDHVSEAEVRAAIDEHRLQDLLRRVPVRAGECYHLPPGTVHAIGAGCVLAEIQQSSNLTYRLYDWGRVGLDGQPRELHVEQGLRVASLAPADCKAGGETMAVEGGFRERLIVGAKFELDLLRLDGSHAADTPGDDAQILCCISGSVRVRAGGGAVDLTAGQTALLPGLVEGFFADATASAARLLVARPGAGS